MARRSVSPPPPPKPPLALRTSRNEAAKKIDDQIKKGKEIESIEIRSQVDLEVAQSESRKWRDYVSRLLVILFTNDEFQSEFHRASYHGVVVLGGGPRSLFTLVSDFRKDVRTGVERLESIFGRLELLDEPDGLVGANEGKAEPIMVTNRKIFVVHGHDEAVKEAVARFLVKLDLQPIILHEMANRGETIIEKFERNADVAFAVVLMTPDDLGGPKEAEKFQPRARQNVIAELGYFVAKLGRGHVMPLVKGDIEVPTDFSGVVYTNFDAAGAWKMELAKELHAAGIKIDPGRLFAT